MSHRRRHVLPEAPNVELEVLDDHVEGGGGFLAVRRVQLVAHREDGTKSAPFSYDVLDRRALDAAIMVAHYEEAGRTRVFLRSAVRPPVSLRPDPPFGTATLWEVPAGLIEPGERPATAAARELEEELGFRVGEADMLPLGSSALPAPGFVGELHFYFHVRVDPEDRGEPHGDGSPLEHGARIESVTLEDALEACRSGEIVDAKTELALRRLEEVLGDEART